MEETLIKRIMPNSLEAEQSVVGSMIMDKDAIVTAMEMLLKEDFYEKAYGMTFDAMVELYSEGQPVDLVTLQNKLKEKDVPKEVSSLEFDGELVRAVTTSANVKYYCNIVKENAMKRKLIRVTEDIENECYAGKESLESVLDKTEHDVFALLSSRTGGEYVPIRQVVMNALEKIEKASQQSGTVTGIPTGFIDLDYRTAGLQPSDLVLVAARPSMGKTAFVLNIAHHLAVMKHIPVGFFSLEMSKEQLASRILAVDAMVDSKSMKVGDLSDDDWDKVIESTEAVANSPLYIEENSSVTISELRSIARKWKQNYGVQVIMIDYLQLMSPSRAVGSRQQFIAEVSRALKNLAKELKIPIIALSQLSRAVDARPDHKPVLSDLRESGSIEQDADVVMFIYRDEYYNPETTTKPQTAEIIIAKQRSGETGSVDLRWIGKYTKFADPEKHYKG